MKKAATLLISVFILLSTAAVCLADATHRVRKGDNLSRIARKYRVGVDAIREANGLSSDDLSVGDRLTIPGVSSRPRTKAARKGAPEMAREKGASSDAAGTAEGTPAKGIPAKETTAAAPTGNETVVSSGARYHTVRKGETLASIARDYDLRVKELKGLNGIRKARRLKTGRRLLVRRGGPRTYIVKDGDNIWTIAKSHGREADQLVEINALESPDLTPGQVLRLDPEEPPSGRPAVPAARVAEMEKAVRALAESEAAPDANPPPGLKDRVIGIARKMLDIPYRFGGNTMLGIDCSGYVQKVFSFLHIELPRSAREQFGIGEKVEKGELSLGDLVFFRTYARYPSHVGIYLGNNEFIHASSKDRRVKIDSLDAPYYVKRFIGARRVLDASPSENGEL